MFFLKCSEFLQWLQVAQGQMVSAQEAIALTGTKADDAYGITFAMLASGKAVDPLPYLLAE